MVNPLSTCRVGWNQLSKRAQASTGDDPASFALAHALQEHPLLSLDALANCALELRTLAGKFCTAQWPVEHHLGNLPIVLPGGRPRQVENPDIPRMIRTIGDNGW